MAWLFTMRRRIPDKGSIGDYAVPGLLLGICIGRIGCFLAGCCYGSPTTLPWAVHFPSDHPSGGVGIHPVQLYDSAFGLVGLVACALLWKRRRFGGEAFAALIVGYAAWRFTTEFVRADADRGVWFGDTLSTSQLVALATIPVTIALWIRALRLARAGKMRKPTDPLPDEDPT
jgi:phosphatidylglycerol:prolipoprotein diacylglycerol transferase